jgi:anti-anti-sigma factor
MEITVKTEENYSLLQLAGRLEATQAAELTEAIQKAMQAAPSLILDCANLGYVASMGLRCFLLAQKGTQTAGGKLVFFGLNENVRSVFALTGFDKITQVRATLEESLACLA